MKTSLEMNTARETEIVANSKGVHRILFGGWGMKPPLERNKVRQRL